MTTLWEKIRLGTLAAAHKVADAMVDMNNVGAVEQQVRDIETAMRAVEGDANGAQADLRQLTRTVKDKKARATLLDAAITEILSDDDPTNDFAATAKQVELDTINEALPGLEEEFTDAQKTSQEIEQALEVLRGQHVTMVAQLDNLRRVNRKAEAKQTATDALRRTREVLASGADVSVDSVVRRVNRKADEADVSFERERGKLVQVTGQNEAIATAQAKIAARKKALQGAVTTAPTPAAH